MVTAELNFCENIQGAKKFSELVFEGELNATEMLGFLEYILTMDKYEKQSAKIDCLKQAKEKKLNVVKLYEDWAKELKITKYFSFFNEDYAKYRNYMDKISKLKNEVLILDEKISELSKNLFYKTSQKTQNQRELLRKMGFTITNTSVGSVVVSEKYKCKISDRAVYERAREMYNNYRDTLDFQIEEIKRSFKLPEVEIIK